MANWKEIQGRIRRAQKSENPANSLAALYEKTHDAMVAFELGRHLEQAGDATGAGRWYSAAAQGFRRPQWKAKAEEALARLGMPPAAGTEAVTTIPSEMETRETTLSPEITGAPGTEAAEPLPFPSAATGEAAGAATPAGKRRRRGRRGGRRHRRGRMGADEIAAPVSPGLSQPAGPGEHGAAPATASTPLDVGAGRTSQPSTEVYPARVDEVPRGVTGPSLRGRAGDPGLSSRMALLESQLRRLLAGTPAGVDEADRAPAGPGVFLLSDTDQQTHYYVEACQTLRIGVGNVLRAGRQSGGRGTTGSALKARLAKHLGITDAKAAKYLTEHCAVRWLQLDEGSNLLAHFAIAVLRPVLNE